MQTKLSKMLKISCRINKLSIVCLKLFNYRFSFLCVYRSMQLFVALSYRLGGLNHLNIDYNYQSLKPCLVCKMNNYLMVCIMLIQKYNCFIKNRQFTPSDQRTCRGPCVGMYNNIFHSTWCYMYTLVHQYHIFVVAFLIGLLVF